MTTLDSYPAYTIKGASEKIGMSESFVRSRMRDGSLKFVQWGKRTPRILAKDLERFIECGLSTLEERGAPTGETATAAPSVNPFAQTIEESLNNASAIWPSYRFDPPKPAPTFTTHT